MEMEMEMEMEMTSPWMRVFRLAFNAKIGKLFLPRGRRHRDRVPGRPGDDHHSHDDDDRCRQHPRIKGISGQPPAQHHGHDWIHDFMEPPQSIHPNFWIHRWVECVGVERGPWMSSCLTIAFAKARHYGQPTVTWSDGVED